LNVEYYTVGPDETLGSIALKTDASVEYLMKWNDLSLGEAREGMRIVVDKEGASETPESDEPRPVIHRVSQGETLGDIAEEYRVTVDQIDAWNPGLNPRRLQIGDRLKLRVPGRNGESVSYGKPSSGRLYNGVVLRDGPGLRVRNLPEAYGTQRTIRLLKAAVADVQARWPNSPDLVVGDLSLAGGGPMPPHKSHQSGRDVDLSFFYKGNVQLPNFEDMTARNFDARKNWHFFKLLIDAGKVEFIFVHMDLQKQLYEYARSIGYTKQQLADILQYPRPASRRVGIIRHTGGHDNHSHVRFTCAPDADRCH
jgi:LysM repeat protein